VNPIMPHWDLCAQCLVLETLVGLKECSRSFRMSITLNQLSTFLAVARSGSVKDSAVERFVTQPSVSAAAESR